ncbi:MAG: hypothetical protein H6799_01790 [Candidatus Nomurabacteria bacterium]|nr:MAG: hypothetical protein H6799_01790 [Candidatus Nomurabacteria bacterium]HRV75887.1 hypothetical protein [Candidatus Saccharimonadales bacterium]
MAIEEKSFNYIQHNDHERSKDVKATPVITGARVDDFADELARLDKIVDESVLRHSGARIRKIPTPFYFGYEDPVYGPGGSRDEQPRQRYTYF